VEQWEGLYIFFLSLSKVLSLLVICMLAAVRNYELVRNSVSEHAQKCKAFLTFFLSPTLSTGEEKNPSKKTRAQPTFKHRTAKAYDIDRLHLVT